MAKKSKIAADKRRREVVARYAERRAELKEKLRHPETRTEALRGLQKLPRDASPTRLRNRDVVDGTAAGVLPRVRAVAHPAAGDGAPR